MRSDATTVEEYLASLPDDRRSTVSAVHDLVRESLQDGFEEQMDYGMITWAVPRSIAPETYNGHPLAYAALASQRNYVSLYLMSLYTEGAGSITTDVLRQRWAGGRRLDLGKSCVRFRDVDDLDLPLLREVIGQCSVEGFAAAATAAHSGRKG